MSSKSHKAMIATVERVASILGPRLDNMSWPRHFSTLVKMTAEEEKGHRGLGHDFAKYHPHAPNVAKTARMFAVKRISEYLNGKAAPGGSDFLHCQKSIFQAYAIVHEYGDLCRASIVEAGADVATLAALDYSVWVSPEEVAK